MFETLLNTCSMDLRLLSFALGASSSLLWPWLPSTAWGGTLLALAILLAHGRHWRLLFLVLGVLWMQLNLQYRLAWLDKLETQTSHIITARVQSTESSAINREINLPACCCGSRRWTSSPSR